MKSADPVGSTKFKSSHSKAKIFLFFPLPGFVSLNFPMQPHTLTEGYKECLELDFYLSKDKL